MLLALILQPCVHVAAAAAVEPVHWPVRGWGLVPAGAAAQLLHGMDTADRLCSNTQQVTIESKGRPYARSGVCMKRLLVQWGKVVSAIARGCSTHCPCCDAAAL
jgi:hypothetical protein